MMETTEARVSVSVALLVSCTVLAGASASSIIGFPTREEIEAPSMATQVLPLQVNTIRTWVFPSMVFNCTGNITRWIFRAEETGNNNTVFPQMSTWRRNTRITRVVRFTRISQSGSAEELTGNGPVYEYVLQEPVEVQEGDVLGIDLIQRGAEELKFEFLDLGNGNTSVSYHRNFSLEIINFPPARRDVTWDRQYLPLITAMIGFPEPNPTFSQTTSTLQATPIAVSTYQSVYLVGTMISATVSATPTQQQSTDVQTGLPVSTIIILSTVLPSTLVLLMLVCTVVVIILIVRWRIARKQVDAAHEHTDSKEVNVSKLNTYAYASKTTEVATTAYMTTEIATTENVAYMTTGDAISATQNVAYWQVPPGTDDCYDYVIQ